MANGTFSYGINTPPNYTPNPPVDYPRLLTSDTVEFGADGTTPVYVFSDQEILAMEQLVAVQFQSAQFFSTSGGPPGGGVLGSYFPSIPIPYYRVAGMLLNSLASNRARLAGVLKLLDVQLDLAKAATSLLAQANAYFEQDDNSGAFMIIEQVNNQFSFRDRYWKQWQRQTFS